MPAKKKKPETEVAVVEKKPMTRKEFFMSEDALAKIQMNALRDVNPEKVMSALLRMIGDNPDIQDCSNNSILGCAVEGVSIGLMPGKLHGYWYGIGYKNHKTGGKDCQFMLGFKGMQQMGYRTGVHSFDLKLVREGDLFEHIEGLNRDIKHTPILGNTGAIIAGYAIARYIDKPDVWDVMTTEEVDKIMNATNSRSGPWKTHYSEMYKKTLMRRLFKSMNVQDDGIQKAMVADDYRTEGIMQGKDFIDTTASEVKPDDTLDELEKTLESDSNAPEVEEEVDDTICADCGTTENVGPMGLCMSCLDASDNG